ncbi:hypothetical protein LX66_4398 [Chitinophaga japonensis]|uniref:Protease n=2 Tax=Chitinophaga japonensis TaxID=104662 RepID=A0A562STB3_CHIJA|nr:hypothetical protein LX66_4398 [Chitinophaga japonensis]
MRNLLTILAAWLSVFFFPACKNSQPANGSTNEALVAVMTIPATVKAGQPVMLHFAVRNPSAKELSFCKWHTPFEGFMDAFLHVQESKGAEAQYRGIMAKRIMPPPADAYIRVPAGDSVSVDIDLLKGYAVDVPGTYTVRYQAGGVSGLEKVNEAAFTVVE